MILNMLFWIYFILSIRQPDVHVQVCFIKVVRKKRVTAHHNIVTFFTTSTDLNTHHFVFFLLGISDVELLFIERFIIVCTDLTKATYMYMCLNVTHLQSRRINVVDITYMYMYVCLSRNFIFMYVLIRAISRLDGIGRFRLWYFILSIDS